MPAPDDFEEARLRATIEVTEPRGRVVIGERSGRLSEAKLTTEEDAVAGHEAG
jgi:hypothetical protein